MMDDEERYRRYQRAEKIGAAITLVGWWIGVLGGFTGFAVACYEGFLWLQSGQWPMLATDVIVRALPLQTWWWLQHPHSWVGLQKVVVAFIGLPLSLMIWILAFVLGGFVGFVGKTQSEGSWKLLLDDAGEQKR